MNGQRTITIGSLFRSSIAQGGGRVPYVRMSGRWLEKAGFACGARLLIARRRREARDHARAARAGRATG